MTTHITHSKEETQTFGKTLAQGLLPGTLLTCTGELGAGKTTLIQGILSGLGALAPYPSPTFVLMNQYELPQSTEAGIARIYHADAYRVGEIDFEKIGFREWCSDPQGLVILEWPERIAGLLPADRIEITLKSLSESDREILVNKMPVG